MPDYFLPTLKQLIRRPITLICWVVATVALAILNGFGAEGIETLSGRFFYWGGLLGLGIVFGALLSRLFLFIRQKRGLIVSRLSGPIIFGAFLVPFIYGYNFLFFSHRMEMLPSAFVVFAFGGLMYAAVILIMDGACYHFTGAPFQTIVVKPSGVAADTARDETADAQSNNGAPVFFDRLTKSNGSKLIRLAMEDHYVHVHTDQGSELILMRLSDAIDELDGLPGLRVHRSHWVTLDGVAGVSKDQGRTYLVTRDGKKVPVSRSYRGAVKAAGLLG